MPSTTIQVAFDPGSSLTKAIYRVGGNGSPKLLLMEPEAIALPKTSIEADRRARGGMGIVMPSNDAWLSYRKKDENVFVIGLLARQLNAEVLLSHAKYESAVPKFLAIIGTIIEQEQLNRTEISIGASLLLPYGEFVDRGSLEAQIRDRARSFYFRGETIRVKEISLSIIPEGGGFIQELVDRRGKEWVAKQEAICILMIGYRNTSLLVFERGQVNPERSQTTERGLAQMVERVVSLTSGQNRERLTPVINKLGSEISADHELLKAMTRTTEPTNVRAEAEQLAEAILTARREYWQQLKAWFDQAVPEEINQLIVCGGTASYLEPEITRDLSWARPEWRSLDSERAQRLQIDQNQNPSLPARLADVYALFESLFLAKQPA